MSAEVIGRGKGSDWEVESAREEIGRLQGQGK